jgi:DNA-binding GntR family transcriptional regulator
MNFQLSSELKSTMDELVYDWIRLHFTEIHQCMVEEMKYNDEYNEEHDDEDNDAFLNEYIKSQLF